MLKIKCVNKYQFRLVRIKTKFVGNSVTETSLHIGKLHRNDMHDKRIIINHLNRQLAVKDPETNKSYRDDISVAHDIGYNYKSCKDDIVLVMKKRYAVDF
jgi:hypothetical protein